MRILLLVLLMCLLLPMMALGNDAKKVKGLTISSPVFADKASIPARYTCDGHDVNPALIFANIPDGTKSLALIVDDPDAPGGPWVHWVLWNIPPQTVEIRENSLPEGASQGLNSWKRSSYGGPCPPSGTHRYFFKLYALDATLDLSPKTGKAQLERAMKGHILAHGQLVGTYRRK